MNYASNSGDGFARPYYAPDPPKPRVTHEAYMAAIRDAALARLNGEAATRVAAAKMVYGAGAVRGAKGFTLYKGWDASHAFVEVAAGLQTTPEGIAETVLHELAHVVAGYGAAHGPEFKAAAVTLGLLNASAFAAAVPEFDTAMVATLASIPTPTDGKPTLNGLGGPDAPPATPKACPAGKGTRGGKVGGKGSGSRLRLYVCGCPVRVRVASDTFLATCDTCGQKFARPEGK